MSISLVKASHLSMQSIDAHRLAARQQICLYLMHAHMGMAPQLHKADQSDHYDFESFTGLIWQPLSYPESSFTDAYAGNAE